jgi:hypothetical protein
MRVMKRSASGEGRLWVVGAKNENNENNENNETFAKAALRRKVQGRLAQSAGTGSKHTCARVARR